MREYVSVQALEPQFYSVLLQKLGLDSVPDLPHQVTVVVAVSVVVAVVVVVGW